MGDVLPLEIPILPPTSTIFTVQEYDGTDEPILTLTTVEDCARALCREINMEVIEDATKEDEPGDIHCITINQDGVIEPGDREDLGAWATYHILDLPENLVVVPRDALLIVLNAVDHFQEDHWVTGRYKGMGVSTDGWTDAEIDREEALELWIDEARAFLRAK